MSHFLINLVKIAQTLDAQNEYIKADMITNFVKQAISNEDIDWSQPDAHLKYLALLQNKKHDPTLVEENKKTKRNPLLDKLKGGFYNDISIKELAKLAEDLNFEVGGQFPHYKFQDKTGKLRGCPNEKFKSGVITIGGHSGGNGIADYQGTRDFAGALKFLGYL